jgi:hypothetical protein
VRERWVVDGNDSIVREALWPPATHVVWLNFSRAVVFYRIIRRTLGRAITRNSGGRMQLLNTLALSLALAASQVLAAPAPIQPAAPYPCPGDMAHISGGTPKDRADICAGASAAVGFFALHGVRPTEPIRIEVTPSIPVEAGPTAAGCFIEEKRRIYVVPYERFRKNATWFNVKIDRQMYRALAVHEAAHAIAACNFHVPNPTIQAKEYLAYAAMFSSMPETLRRNALRGTETVGFNDIERFTPMLYMFDPMRFGAEAYLHFSKLVDPAKTVRAILAGKELTN